MSTPRTYSGLQIALHWVIAALVLFQLVFEGGIDDDMYEGLQENEIAFLNPHVVVGLLILALVVIRLGLRIQRGVPAAPSVEPQILQLLAKAAHWAFYGVLFMMPLSGIAIWFFGVEAAEEIHELGETALIVLILLHVAGAFAHLLLFRDKVFHRMLGRA